MPNRLTGETSPYLLQHKDNPVDWHPWGTEALERAKREDRPLLVSVGYSACHWCHVMERESFEDPAIAALMNEHFVCVKVDREERPDVDAILMDACQAMTGRGGWPLNAFLTPDQVPFYVGTYFPPTSAHGMPAWRDVLSSLADAYRTRRTEIDEQSPRLLAHLGQSARQAPDTAIPSAEDLARATENLLAGYDNRNGGWGGAPKFPQASAIEFLLARGETEVAAHALTRMAEGGIYDQVGGGFARYAVDATWTVPHFEKMLYDNALLARVYLHGFQATGELRLRRVCTETLDFILRELTGPEGGFLSALDADSEGVEGKFYVWSIEELRAVLGDPLAEGAIAYFGATPAGNFEHGTNVLEARGPEPPERDMIRCKLYGARSKRIRPELDDKRLTAWNALAICALAEAGAVLERRDYLDAALACAAFIETHLHDDAGRLLRTWKDGRASYLAYLEDHAFLLEALIVLYEATGEASHYARALELADTLIARFADPDPNTGGFFTTAEDHERLPVRRKDLEDTPIPSGSSSAALALQQLASLSGNRAYDEHAHGVLRLNGRTATRHPSAFGQLLLAADFAVGPTREVALVGRDTADLERAFRATLRPRTVLAVGRPGASTPPLLEHRTEQDGRAAAYVCEHFSCRAPVTTGAELDAALRQ